MPVFLSDSYGGDMTRADRVRTADELTTLVAQLGRRLRAASAEAELTPSQQSVMGRLGREGPATTAALARGELVRPQSMRMTLAALEERGFVTRAPHATDGRQVVFSLTAQGTDLLGSGRAARRGWLADALDTRLTPDEHRVLAAAVPLLRRLVESPQHDDRWPGDPPPDGLPPPAGTAPADPPHEDHGDSVPERHPRGDLPRTDPPRDDLPREEPVRADPPHEDRLPGAPRPEEPPAADRPRGDPPRAAPPHGDRPYAGPRPADPPSAGRPHDSSPQHRDPTGDVPQ